MIVVGKKSLFVLLQFGTYFCFHVSYNEFKIQVLTTFLVQFNNLRIWEVRLEIKSIRRDDKECVNTIKVIKIGLSVATNFEMLEVDYILVEDYTIVNLHN